MSAPRQRVPRNGKSVREIAERTGFSTNTIIRWTSEPREDYLRRGHERAERIRELRAEGLTMRAIAERLDCSVGTVHRALKNTTNTNV